MVTGVCSDRHLRCIRLSSVVAPPIVASAVDGAVVLTQPPKVQVKIHVVTVTYIPKVACYM